MPGVIANLPKFQFSANGVPMVGGTLTVYVAGSTTPANTWQDFALSIANTNPIALDARGECVLWLDEAVIYKFVLKNAQGVTQWTQDNINSAAPLRTDLAAPGGTTLIAFTPNYMGGVTRLLSLKLSDWVTGPDCGVVSDGVTDDTDALLSGLSKNKVIFLLAGTPVISRNVGLTSNQRLLGSGRGLTVLKCVSPTGNGRFGGLANNQAAVFSQGVAGAPTLNPEVHDLTIDCGGLLNATGGTGLKGLMFRRAHDAYARRVHVKDSASYAFWTSDDIGAATRASSVMDDCSEENSEIGFEAVNVSYATYNRCRSYKKIAKSYVVGSSFHAYGLADDALVTYNDCIGVAEAVSMASNVIDLTLKCRNVRFSGGYFHNKVPGNPALVLATADGTDYHNLDFAGVLLIANGPAVLLNAGTSSTAVRPKIKFLGGRIISLNGDSVTLQGATLGDYEFIGTDMESTVLGGGAAHCILELSPGNRVQVTGGSMFATGGAGTGTTVLTNAFISPQTKQTPASASGGVQVKQKVVGFGILQDAGTFGFLTVPFGSPPNFARVSAIAFVNATGAADGPTAAAAAVAVSWLALSTTEVRFYANGASSVGKKIAYEITEYA